MASTTTLLAAAATAAPRSADDTAALVFIDLAVILVVARAMGMLLKRLGQPPVIGEIIAGIALGPSLLGLLPGQLPTDVFPLDIRPYLSVLGQIGLIIFMFTVGTEVDVARIRRQRRTVGVIALSAMALPFGLGLILASVVHSSHIAGATEAARFWPFALFVGVTLSITAFPVLARILSDRGLQRTEIGSSALACAAIADVIAWTLLALVLVVVQSKGAATLPIHLVELAIFVTVMFTLIKPLLLWLSQRYPDAPHAAVLIVLAVGLFTSSYLTERMGVHQMFGAFLFGCVMPRSATTRPARDTVEGLKQLGLLFLPVFFVVTGFSVQVTSLGADAAAQLPLIIALAVFGKVVGTTVSARAQGVPANRATALGVLMNTRGLTELIVLNVGKELGILDTSLFTMLVFMALITTLMTAPLLRIPWLRRVLDHDLELIGGAPIRPDGAPG